MRIPRSGVSNRMCAKISLVDLPKLFEKLESCLTVVKRLELIVTEVYDVIKLLEALKFIQISDGTQLWKRLYEELVHGNGATDISSQTTPESEVIASNDSMTKQQEDSDIHIENFSNNDSVGYKLVEQSVEEVVWLQEESSGRDENDDIKQLSLNEVSIDDNNEYDDDDDDDVVVIEVDPGVTSMKIDDSWGPLYQHEESSSDNDSFELFIMEVKQKQQNIKSTPYPTTTTTTTTTQQSSGDDTKYFSADSAMSGHTCEEDAGKKSLFEEISNSVHSRRSMSHRKSFTHVTITEDCIEAEEYLEDDSGSSVADDNGIVKRLFSEDDKADLSQPASNSSLNVLPTPFCTPVSIMDNLKTTYYNVNFNKFREKMVHDLFHFYNVAVFDSKFPGDFEITWNTHLTKTAGLCYYSQVDKRIARIELSTKVCTDFERLRDVLIHELCHAATWILDGVKCGHGAQWKNWTQRACQIIPGLPAAQTCHQYDIHTKYTYHCTQCDYSIGRHSKSINLTTHRCPLCTSQLKLQPKLKADGTPRKQNTSRFAQFVKENYSSVRKQTPDHRQVMSKLAMMYKQHSTL